MQDNDSTGGDKSPYHERDGRTQAEDASRLAAGMPASAVAPAEPAAAAAATPPAAPAPAPAAAASAIQTQISQPTARQEAEPEEQVWIHGDLDETDDAIDENVTDTDSVAFQERIRRMQPSKLTAAERFKKNMTVISAIIAGTTVAIVKFIAAALTGSMAMLSEGVHSLVDAANDSLMLVGQRGSKKAPDLDHPFGYGRMVYFYTFIVSVVILVFGGGFTVIQGINSLLAGGHEIGDPTIAYIVLAIGVAIEGVSLTIAFRDVNRSRGDQDIWSYIRDSKSPTNFTVLLEDMAAVLGMVFAFVGLALSVHLNDPVYDSIASIMIGALMGVFAVVLVRESASLLIGEGLTRDQVEDIVYIVENDPAVIKCGRVLSMYIGPADLLLNVDVTFDDELDEGDILQAIDRIEAEIVDDFPECHAIFIEVESLNQVYRQRFDRKVAFDAEDDE